MAPLNKIKEILLRVDEVQCLELLDIKTEEILERFEDKILARIRYISKELEYVPDEKYEELNFN
jgi:hypothetical protein